MSTIAKAFTNGSIAWAVSSLPVDYPVAVAAMEARATATASRDATELVWLLEHTSCYTAGTSAKPQDLLSPVRFPVFHSGRGGQFTYHGPGQRIVYVMLDLRRWTGGDVRAFVRKLEQWLVSALKELDVDGSTDPKRIGIWVAARPPNAHHHDAKIAAIGLRVRKGVSLHGLSLNVSLDLDHFDGIVPCGIHDRGITSLAALKKTTALPMIDRALKAAFEHEFGPTTTEEAPDLHLPTSRAETGIRQTSSRRESA